MTDEMKNGISIPSDGRLKEKLSGDFPLSLLFLGGSVTEGWCRNGLLDEPYAKKVSGFVEKHFCRSVTCDNYAVSTFCSAMGLVQYSIINKPYDIVFLEYAVNDCFEIYNATTYESLVRRILSSEGSPAVIVVCSCKSDGSGAGAFMREIASYYHLPAFSVAECIPPDKYSQYCPDGIHPEEWGHEILAELCCYILDNAADGEKHPLPHDPCFGKTYESMRFYDRSSFHFRSEGFTGYSFNQMFSQGFSHIPRSGGSLSFTIKKGTHCGTMNMIYIIGSDPRFYGKCDVFVNGRSSAVLDGYSIYGWDNPVSFGINLDTDRDSEITIAMHSGDEDKHFDILGFAF